MKDMKEVMIISIIVQAIQKICRMIMSTLVIIKSHAKIHRRCLI
jgi:hypothetical protein